MHRRAWLRGTAMAMGALLFLAPATRTEIRRPGVAASANLVTIEKAMSGPYSGRALVVANDSTDWNAAMLVLAGAHALQVTPPPPAPAGVDWQNEVVVLLASGFTGYDVELVLSPAGNGQDSLGAVWTPLGIDASWATPYHLVHTVKRPWIPTQVVLGDSVALALPLVGPEDVPLASRPASWGLVKALYHQ